MVYRQPGWRVSSRTAECIARSPVFRLAVLILVWSTPVRGQPGFEKADSIEWRAADADVIVRATIHEFVQAKGRRGESVCSTVTFAVDETLKGQHRPQITASVRSWVGDRSPEAAKLAKTPLLCFLIKSERLEKRDQAHELAVRDRDHWTRGYIDLTKGKKLRQFSTRLFLTKPYAEGLEVITDPDELFRRTKSAIAATKGVRPTRSHTFQHGNLFLTFAVDALLEKLARKWVAASAKDAGTHRGDAAKALGYFESDANRAILTKLLGDDAYSVRERDDGPWAIISDREFYVRKAAYEALRSWGDKVDKPVLVERIVRKETDPAQRAAITKILARRGAGVRYDKVSSPARYRSVVTVWIYRASKSDVDAIAKLPKLRILHLSQAGVRDVSVLVSLKELRDLNLQGCRIVDLTDVGKMKQLETLRLDGSRVVDLSPLAKLERLRSLDLSSTKVTDLSPLAGLASLRILELRQSRVSNLTPLAGLTGMTHLSLNETPVESLEPLSRLVWLKHLDLEGTRVRDVSPLADLSRLELLKLGETGVSDVASLVGLKGLRHIDLSGTKVRDVSPLRGLEGIWPLSRAFLPDSLR